MKMDLHVMPETPERQRLLQEFFAAISRNSTWTVMFHQAAALRMGLNPTDLKCVGLLQETGPIAAGELAAFTGLTTGAITAVLDRLEKVELVRRIADPHDRRRVIVEPIENPARIADSMRYFAPLAQSTNELLADYSDAELAIILDFVRRGADLMREQTARVLKQ
jgi:DNA-binding MarR family transcriptional regulator